MAAPQLSGTQRTALAKASPESIRAAASRLAGYLADDRWLGKKNRYMRRSVKVVKGDAKNPSQAIPKHLAEYIAASTILHCADGWSYLGRGIGALLCGDSTVARHLGYYAELRAAIALLATRGIGIFSNQNVVMDPSSKAQFFAGGGTHKTTWLALDFWTKAPDASSFLAAILQPQGTSIQDWIAELGHGSGAWPPVAGDWLRSWGLDIRAFGRDRTVRNEASYRPTLLRGALPRDTPADASFVRSFWPLFEPSAGQPFSQLDAHLLRISLERAFRSTTGREPIGDGGFESSVGRAVRSVTDRGSDSPLGRFLLRRDVPTDPLLLQNAAVRASHLDPRYHVHVLSRAALMLRVASGAGTQLMRNAGVAPPELAFWRRQLAEDHGLCLPGAFPHDPTDLWADVVPALHDLEAVAGAGNDGSPFAVITAVPSAVQTLTGCERMAMWGLAA